MGRDHEAIQRSFDTQKLLSALYGIYVNEKKIKLSSTMADLKIDDNDPSLSDEEKKARVSDLLKARSGIYHPALYETPGMKAARPKRHSHKPGAFWYYNNWDFNALGTIFEQSTELSISQAFKQRIADPLEMEDYRLEDTQYVRGDDSIHHAYPFRMTARDMARFGLLFLRRGEWRGKQVVPRSWIAESTRSYSDAGPSGGYGYMWWVAANGRHLPQVTLKDGAYSAQGAGGHYILVIPDLDLVIVHRVNTDPPARSVNSNQFGSLVKMILDAKSDKANASR